MVGGRGPEVGGEGSRWLGGLLVRRGVGPGSSGGRTSEFMRDATGRARTLWARFSASLCAAPYWARFVDVLSSI